jgi:hypothetical protein
VVLFKSQQENKDFKSFSSKEMNSASNLNELGSEFFPSSASR